MWSAKTLVLLCCGMLALMLVPGRVDGDMIKFKRGGVQKCVVIEETEESVRFLTSMGTASMPRSRIESIEHESEEVNNKLKEKWEQKKKRSRVEQPKPKPAKKKEAPVLRTYNIELTRRRIALGGRATGVAGEQQVATFVIKDLGMIKGKRLFKVDVTSHRSGARTISDADFHAFLRNDMRMDSETLEGFDRLDATLRIYETASGHLAFPTDAKLETLALNSQVADFDLNLETGEYTTRDGPF